MLFLGYLQNFVFLLRYLQKEEFMESWKKINTILDDDRKQREQKVADAKEMLEYIKENDKAELKRVLLTGASPNCSYMGETPLMACVRSDNLSLAIYLLSGGASASYAETLISENAFWVALRNQKYDFLEMFVINNCNVTRAYPSHDLKEREKLLPKEERTLAVMSPEDDSETALIFATKFGDANLVEILLTHPKIRKKINEIDRKGRTALHYNLGKTEMTDEDIQIGKMLLAAGADSAIRDLEGLTADKVAMSDTAKSVLLNAEVSKVIDKAVENNKDLDDDFQPERPSFKL